MLGFLRTKLKKLELSFGEISKPWQDYIPTLTWTTTTPTGIITKAKYRQIGKTLFYNISVYCTDMNGTTGVRISLPIVPKANNMIPSFVNVFNDNGSFAYKHWRVRDDGVNNDLQCVYLGTLVAGKYANISLQGQYEVN